MKRMALAIVVVLILGGVLLERLGERSDRKRYPQVGAIGGYWREIAEYLLFGCGESGGDFRGCGSYCRLGMGGDAGGGGFRYAGVLVRSRGVWVERSGAGAADV